MAKTDHLKDYYERTASRFWDASKNDYYWRDAWYKRVGPSAYFYVFRKPGIE